MEDQRKLGDQYSFRNKQEKKLFYGDYNEVKMTNDELEQEGLMLVCKHCGSANIREIGEIEGEKKDMCGTCGTVDYTKLVTEEEFDNLQNSETIQ